MYLTGQGSANSFAEEFFNVTTSTEPLCDWIADARAGIYVAGPPISGL